MSSVSEEKTLQPARFAGHGVVKASLITLGMQETWLTYAAGPALVATLNVTASTTPADAAAWQSPRLRALEQPSREELAFLSAHPTRNWLCAGTTQHGLYLTAITHPLFSGTTRLPLAVTGEAVYCAAFLAHRSAPHSIADDAKGDEEEEDILVFSSALKARSGLCASRLSLWHVRDRYLLYRGSMEALQCLCAFPHESAFVACAGHTVLYFVAYDPARTRQETSQPTRYHMRVSLSRCTTVEELSGAEYVQCAIPPTRDGAPSSLFLALTTGGFLVAFDRASSTVLRWMDTKISHATALFATPELLLLTGELARFFSTERWEVRGRVRRESVSNDAAADVYSAAVCTSRHLALFARDGEWALYAIGAPREVGDGKSARLNLHRCFHFTPVPPTESPPLWLLPRTTTTPVWGLWSPGELRLLTHELCQVRPVSRLVSSCAAFHTASNVLLVYNAEAHSVVAYAVQEGWQERARLEMASEDAITALCCAASGDLCAGLRAAGSAVTYFTCQWQGTGGVLELRHHSHRDVAPRWQLRQLCFLGGSLHAVTAQDTLVDLDTERELRPRGAPRAVCAVGANAVVVSRDACEYYDTRLGELRLMRLPAHDLRHVSYDAQSDLLAVGAAHVVLLYRMSTATVLYTMRHGGDPHARALALCADALQVRLLVCDARGLLSVYDVESSAAPFLSSARTPRGDATAPREQSHSAAATVGPRVTYASVVPHATQVKPRRAASAGAPSSRELSDRLDALTSLFAQQKAHAASRSHHRHGVLRRSLSSTNTLSSTRDVVGGVPPGRIATTPRSTSSQGSAVSPVRPAARDGLAGVSGDPLRISAVAGVEVSALTIDPDDRAVVRAPNGAATMLPRLELPTETHMLHASTMDADDVLDSPPRGGGGGPDRLVLQSDEDDNRFFASARDAPATCVEQLPTPATPPPPPLDAGDHHRSTSTSSVSTQLVEQSRQLRGSLRQWTSLLEQSVSELDASHGSATDESASQAGEAEELHELSGLLTNALRALQRRQALLRPSSAATSQTDTTRDASHYQDALLSSLLEEVSRIRQQSSRLEEQNQLILRRLDHAR